MWWWWGGGGGGGIQTQNPVVGWCFEPSQSWRITSELKELVSKELGVEPVKEPVRRRNDRKTEKKEKRMLPECTCLS